jgi:hypothetical protein
MNKQGPTVQAVPVQGADGLQRFIVTRHLHEAEASAFAVESVENDLGARDRAMSLEQSGKVIRRGGERQVAHIKKVCHATTSSVVRRSRLASMLTRQFRGDSFRRECGMNELNQ